MQAYTKTSKVSTPLETATSLDSSSESSVAPPITEISDHQQLPLVPNNLGPDLDLSLHFVRVND